jgi:hypothetical protein
MYPIHLTSLQYLYPEPGQTKVAVEGLSDYLARNTLRRMGHYERMGLLSAIRCLEKAAGDFKNLPCAAERMGIILATCYGPIDNTFSFLDLALESGHNLASPTAFSTSVYNILATSISMHIGITGPALSVSQGIHSMGAAIIQAGLLLSSRTSDYVLLGIIDQYSLYLNRLISELNDPAILPAQDIALFMLLANKDQPCGEYLIYDVNYGLHADTIILHNSNYLLHDESGKIDAAPAGPVHSIIEAVKADTSLLQRCCLAVPGQGFSYVDIKRVNEQF